VLVGQKARIKTIFEVRWHTRGKGMVPLGPIKPSGSTQEVCLRLVCYWRYWCHDGSQTISSCVKSQMSPRGDGILVWLGVGPSEDSDSDSEGR
jgi:hypothetical protein